MSIPGEPTEDLSSASVLPGQNPEKKELSPAARRALEEAEQRRLSAEIEAEAPEERGGPKGPEPTRFGDWERKGIVSDF